MPETASEARRRLESVHGRVWNTEELTREFEVIGFLAPYAVVRRRADDVTGSIRFQHEPRFYFCFERERSAR